MTTIDSIRQLYRQRVLAQVLIARKLKARYRGAFFGFLWTLLNPLVLTPTFSKNCVERMNRVKTGGKTIVLVTHSLDVVRSWCDYGVWLYEGILKLQGSPGAVVAAYVKAI